MTDMDDIKQKAKGEANKIKGEIEQNTGQPVQGTYDKYKGEAVKKEADIQTDDDNNE